ncbi:uncharacterized protein J8A68_006009 [[Candida] subhashii]|uniref:DOC domain-containing protein n=1 Tax=[Candida] subhashii TaxID=561895 RepID=A0A8J5UIU6_9ASCO|nr:uncharacterized protein J8A68_006009 [[Candida] subhashii]KAG7660481.1 hypothetical protein J8A68_006009 [[Candida] subhashii]
MNASGYWDQSSLNDQQSQQQQQPSNSSSTQHELQHQSQISYEEIQQSIISSNTTNQHHHHFIQNIEETSEHDDNDSYSNTANMRIRNHRHHHHHTGNNNYHEDGDNINEAEEDDESGVDDDDDDGDDDEQQMIGTNEDEKTQPSLEQIQRVYYTKGLQEIENLQLFDLSPLANWKLSSFKSGFGLAQLRDDSPDTYWQSDGSNGNTNNSNNSNNGNSNNANNSAIVNNQLNNPHCITIQFSKRVSLERISIFTNYSLDESYTPSKIRIMAGTSESSDLIEVCTVNFTQPIGWSHIIFNGIRNDGVLKCFLIKLIILANHQEGKDSHIRAIRCFGKKSSMLNKIHSKQDEPLEEDIEHREILKDISMASGSTSITGLSINNRNVSGITQDENINEDGRTSKILNNVSHIIGFNTGFESLEFKSISSIR